MKRPAQWLIAAALAGLPAIAHAADWPQWGRDHSKNMVSAETGLPVEATAGEAGDEGVIDPKTTKNVKWVAKLGSQTYGNPVVANGRVYVGTNNDSPRDPNRQGDYGVLMCLDEATGKFLWQLASPKLAAGTVSDWEQVGLCSSPAVEGERLYVITNRCEVLCLDVNGMANGNDGPFTDEAGYVGGPDQPPATIGPADADIIWRYDMRDELGVFPHQMTSSSPLVVGGRVYATTSNGVDWTLKHVPFPDAPALICLDKQTGRLVGQERSGISRRMFKCNWSSPAYGEINGKGMVFFGGGDGWCYAFDPAPGTDGTLKEIWRFDCNAPEYRKGPDGQPIKHGKPKGPSEIVATPVFANDRVYVAIGQDPEAGDGVGRLNCINPAAGMGDITQAGRVWAYDQIGRSTSTASVGPDGLLYVADFAGKVYCVDANTGREVWVHDTQSRIWGSTLLADGKVYVGNEDGFVQVLQAGRAKKLLGEIEFGGPVYSSPLAANGVLYVTTDQNLYALRAGGGQ